MPQKNYAEIVMMLRNVLFVDFEPFPTLSVGGGYDFI